MKNEQAFEQYTLFDMQTETNKYINQHKSLVLSKQNLKINSAKILRLAMMQVEETDKELKPYYISIKELSELFDISPNNLYRDIRDITKEIGQNPFSIEVEDEDGVKMWQDLYLISVCQFSEKYGLIIKLNDALKPYLLNLKGDATKYLGSEILTMRSTYAIRIYEILMEKINGKFISDEGINLEFSVDYLRTLLNCTDKLTTFYNFRSRVIDMAINEINEKTPYKLDYSYKKLGKVVNLIIFNIKRK